MYAVPSWMEQRFIYALHKHQWKETKKETKTMTCPKNIFKFKQKDSNKNRKIKNTQKCPPPKKIVSVSGKGS